MYIFRNFFVGEFLKENLVPYTRASGTEGTEGVDDSSPHSLEEEVSLAAGKDLPPEIRREMLDIKVRCGGR